MSMKLEVEGGLARLTLARPAAGNAIDRSFVEGLRSSTETLLGRTDVRAVLLHAEGPSFCVGGDLVYFSSLLDGEIESAVLAMAHDLHAGIAALRALDAPVIAAVQGAAAGGGLSLVCAADLALAAESAHFTMAYTGAGLSPDGGGSWFLPRIVGPRFASEMLLTNRRLTAVEAKEAGIINHVVANETLESASEELAARIAAGPANAFASVKRLLQASSTATLAEQLDAEARDVARNAAHPDFREAATAFLAKRRPEFGTNGAAEPTVASSHGTRKRG
jgi:2-(1,2-epoxy-1,2-dihydrophenyl)acetyl-CoA isomerase